MRLTVLLRLTQLKLMLGRCQLPICFYSTFHLRPMRCISEGRSNNRWRNSVKRNVASFKVPKKVFIADSVPKAAYRENPAPHCRRAQKWMLIILFCCSFWTSVCRCQQSIIALKETVNAVKFSSFYSPELLRISQRWKFELQALKWQILCNANTWSVLCPPPEIFCVQRRNSICFSWVRINNYMQTFQFKKCPSNSHQCCNL